MYASRLRPSFLIVFLLIMLFMSACASPFSSTNTVAKNIVPAPTPFPTPTVDAATLHQGQAQLQVFQQWISLMKQYGGSTGKYQQQYATDQQALQNASTIAIYTKALNTLDTHVKAIQLPAIKAEATGLHQQLLQKADAWGQQHTYYNAPDNTTYHLGFEYTAQGIGGWSQSDIDSSQTLADYQQTIENLQMYLYNFQQMDTNSRDTTPYNRPHQTDMALMKHYGKTSGVTLVVSLQEQAMRVYDNGTLINSFLVTTGRPDRPTPPGVWWVEGKQTHTTFKSGVKPGQPGYYPDTPINYAIAYHSNGYFVHDSWWRDDYGPHMNFPHTDSSGDSFANFGSHGCVNMRTSDVGWVYAHIQLFTSIIIY